MVGRYRGKGEAETAMSVCLLTLRVWLALVVLTIFFSLLALFSFPFDRHKRLIHLYARLWAKVILWVTGTKVKVVGKERLSGGPFLLMSNHLSAYDIFVLLASLPHPFRWVAKERIFKIPFLGWAMRCAGYVSVDRKNPKKAFESIEAMKGLLKDGLSILIFPEGTRSPDGNLGPFLTGGFNIAIRLGVPIIPISIVGTYEIMPRHTLMVLKPGEVTLRIGEPIATQGMTPKDKKRLVESVREAISQGIREGRAWIDGLS